MSVFIVGAKRTPFGAFGGKLKGLTSTDLAVLSSKGAMAAAKVDPSTVGDVFFGNVITSSLDAPYLARHVGLKSGVPIPTPAMTINRLCGSGFETVILGAESIMAGRSQIALCGGAENMSQAPMIIDGLSARFGTALGKGLKAEDALWAGLTDSYTGTPMGITAEKLAEAQRRGARARSPRARRARIAQTPSTKPYPRAGVDDEARGPPHPRMTAGSEDFRGNPLRKTFLGTPRHVTTSDRTLSPHTPTRVPERIAASTRHADARSANTRAFASADAALADDGDTVDVRVACDDDERPTCAPRPSSREPSGAVHGGDVPEEAAPRVRRLRAARRERRRG